jgi:hypothetical protein
MFSNDVTAKHWKLIMIIIIISCGPNAWATFAGKSDMGTRFYIQD